MNENKIDRRNVEDVMGLTSMQEGMLFHYLSNPHSKQYFEQIRLKLSGPMDIRQFEEAWRITAKTNEVLRSVFRWKKLEYPVQIILENHEIPIRIFDLSGENKEACQGIIDNIIKDDKSRSIDLNRAPFRIKLCKLKKNQSQMLLTFHHILLDGWSIGILLAEFLEAINRLLKGETPKPIHKTRYIEFFKWYKNTRQQQALQQREFWQNYLEGFDTRTLLPYDTNKLAEIQQVNTRGIEISSSFTAQMEACAHAHNLTISTILYAAWGILLQKYNNSNDIIFGTTVSGRVPEVSGIDRMAALFINTLPLRLKAAKTDRVLDIFHAIGSHLQKRDVYQHSSLTQMKQFTDLGTDNDLFDSIIVIDNYPLDKILNRNRSPGVTVTEYDAFEMTHFDLTLQVMMIDAVRVRIDFHYNADCFELETIKRLQGHYMNILEGMTCNSSIKLTEISMLSGEEKRQIMEEFNNPFIEFQVNKTIHGIIESQAARTPNNRAVQFREQWLTYRAFNKKADRLAYLLREHGVSAGTGSRVAIMIPRSIAMIVAVLGILKAGAACIPLDVSYPEERNSFIVLDSEAKFLLTSQPGTIDPGKTPGVTEIVYDPEAPDVMDIPMGDPGKSAAPGDLSYIIYTSGSTGNPKGALLHHSGVVNHTYTKIDVLGITEKDTVGNNFSINVIASVWQILSPLFTGARLVVYPEEIEWDPLAQFQQVDSDGVTIIEVIPSVLKAYLSALAEGKEKVELKCLRKIALTSEETKPSLVNHFYKTYSHIDLVDCYGQTECCDDVLHYTIPHDTETVKVPVGTPSLNTQVFILSHHDQLQPVGVTGEICVTGAGVAYGYWKRPELNAEKFGRVVISHSSFVIGSSKSSSQTNDQCLLNNDRFYKTGDLGRWLPDGKVEYLGRIDHQVKIRGNRVELREIENYLLRYPPVKEAAVVDREDRGGEKNLYAFFVSSRDITISEIRQYLLKTLPDYMIPTHFVPMEKLPLTPNGKIDRKELGKLEINENIYTGTQYKPPRTELEKKIAAIWSRLLAKDKEQIGINDNFFHLGGHSLKITALVGLIYKELKVDVPFSVVFNGPTIRELARYISGREKFGYNEIPPAEEKEYYSLSSAQRRLLLLQQMDENAIVYNMPSVWQLEGDLDKEKFAVVFRQLIRRHECLRTSFEMVEEEPVQRIHREVEFEIEYYEGQFEVEAEVKVEPAARSPQPAAAVIRAFVRPFDLSRAPLLRVGLIEPAEGGTGTENRHGHTIILLDMHHIISDGTSMNILAKDFMALYNERDLPGSRNRYKYFLEWQHKKQWREMIKHQEIFWLKEFSDQIPVLNVPADFERPALPGFEGAVSAFEIQPDVASALKSSAEEKGVTLYMILLSLYVIFLAKLCNQEDIVVGTPVAGRWHADMEGIIGMFVNTLALRNYPSGEKTFNGFLREVKEKVLSVFDNREYQYEDLVEQVAVERDTSRNPLFDTMFVMQNIDMVEIEIPGLKLSPYLYDNKIAKFDLTLTAVEAVGKLSFTFEYSTKLFSEGTIERFITYFKKITSGVLCQSHKDIKLAEIDMISTGEKRELLIDFNDTGAGYPQDKSIHRLFEEQVEKTPDHIALTGTCPEMIGESPLQISYNQLNEKSVQLAFFLIGKSVRSGTIVGILGERSIDMIIGILGILKTGGTYMPIDRDYPQERIDYMLKDSGARVLVTGVGNRITCSADLGRQFSIANYQLSMNAPIPTLHHSSFSDHHSVNPAYVVYTSGSTGRPKGVGIEHRSVVNYICWASKIYVRGENVNFPLYTSIAFDLTVTSIFTPLITGNAVIVYGEHKTPLEQIENIINDSRVGVMKITPAHLAAVKETVVKNTCLIKRFIVGGENLSGALAASIHKKFNGCIEIYNEYGPTEATVGCMIYRYTAGNGYPVSVPIGRPVDNVKIYIMDKYGQPVVQGAAGEIYIFGDGLARGYLNNPELTNEKFDQDLWDYRDYQDDNQKLLRGVQGGGFLEKSPPGRRRQKLYRTGDLARRLNDGNIEFLGRIDHQVKIRGYRIELGEIENRLLAHESIKKSAVICKNEKNNDNYLCAYIVSTHQLPVSALREYLLKHLPEYMIPAYFIRVDKIPLTNNGKIDRKALPDPEIKAGDHYEAPRDRIEKKLLELWAEILARDASHASQLQKSIGIDDNFFHLGGHSLKAAILVSKIHKELAVKVPLMKIFMTPDIRRLASFIKNAETQRFFSIEPAEKKEYYMISPAQRRLSVLQQMDENGTGYNMPSVWQLEGKLDGEKFEMVFQQLIRRHESLRTSFKMVEEEPVQRIHREVGFEIERFEPVGSGQITHHFVRSFIRPFDLSLAPLLRVGLIEVEKEKHILMVDMHHIISDGLSGEIFVKEFMEFYAGKKPPALKLQYKDYSEWHIRQTLKKPIKRQEAYWLKEFSGVIPVLDLPTDYPRPPVPDFTGAACHFEIDKEETDALTSTANEQGVTLFMLLLSLYSACLSRLSRQEEIVVGTSAAGRRHADLEPLMGMFVNTLALRHFPRGSKPFTQFLKEVEENTIKAFENQDYPYEDLVEKVSVTRDVSRNPLFDTMFVLQNTGSQKIEIPGLKSVPYEYETKTSKFDLTLIAVEAEGKLLLTFEYSTKLFKAETIERFIPCFVNIVGGVVENRQKRIFDFDIITEQEKRRILLDFNDTGAEYPRGKRIHQLFAEQAGKTPDGVALVGSEEKEGQTTITYRELNKRSDRLATVLQEKGVTTDTITAIMLERSIDMCVAILGTLKAGGAYLPIDPGYPKDRIDYMLKDSGAKVLLTNLSEGHPINCQLSMVNGQLLMSVPKRPLHHSSFITRHSDLSYVIYTSGSTGKPKGVLVRHDGVTNAIYWRKNEYRLGVKDNVLQLFSFAFDGFVTSFFTPIVSGSRVVFLPGEGPLDISAVKKAIVSIGITHFISVPSIYRSLLESCSPGDLSNLRVITLAGEAVDPVLLEKSRQLNPRLNVMIEYGATENTVVAAIYRNARPGSGVFIGKPVANTKIYILDRSGHLSPIGVSGEISIAGIGVARGYLNRPELTEEKFTDYKSQITNKEEKGTGQKTLNLSLYRTGDLARWLPDGNIEFLGRIDHQVKIRGFRVELGEIENRLRQHDRVKDTAVVVTEDKTGDKSLAAYFVSDPVLSDAELRDYLLKDLPDYMIPSYFVRLDKIPLTPSGKIDRRGLPLPEVKKSGSYVPPRSEIEKKLVRIWAEVLGRDAAHASQLQTSIGIDDNFFRLGGHSLKATVMANKIQKNFGVTVAIHMLFRFPTIAAVAGIIKSSNISGLEEIEKLPEQPYYEMSYAQKRLWYIYQRNPRDTAFNMPVKSTFYEMVDTGAVRKALEQLMIRHEGLRTSFKEVNEGPVQVIESRQTALAKLNFTVLDLSQLDQGERENQRTRLLIEEWSYIFNLEKGPLFRARLVRCSGEEYDFILNIHHIVSDGWSIEVLKKEFLQLHESYKKGITCNLEPLNIQYKDYAAWQNKLLTDEGKMGKAKEFWKNYLHNSSPALNLPYDFSAKPLGTKKSSAYCFFIEEGLTERLRLLARQQGSSLFMVLLAAFNILLSHITYQDIILVGIPAAARQHWSLQNIIGLFVNTLILQTKINAKETFSDFMGRFQTDAFNVLEYQGYPLEIIFGELKIKYPEILAFFNMLNLGSSSREDIKKFKSFHIQEVQEAKFAIHCYLAEYKNGIRMECHYFRELFRPETIEKIMQIYTRILENMAEYPLKKIKELTRKIKKD